MWKSFKAHTIWLNHPIITFYCNLKTSFPSPTPSDLHGLHTDLSHTFKALWGYCLPISALLSLPIGSPYAPSTPVMWQQIIIIGMFTGLSYPLNIESLESKDCHLSLCSRDPHGAKHILALNKCLSNEWMKISSSELELYFVFSHIFKVVSFPLSRQAYAN